MGQDEDALAAMRSAGLIRENATPLRIEPQRGQVTEDDVESPNNESADVLHEDELGSHLANDACELSPEPGALPVGDAGTLPGLGDVLAGEAASDEIHDSTPRAAVEGADVAPDRSRSQPPFCHARSQYRGGIGFPLHETDRANARSLQTEGESAAAGEQFDGT